jgi:hypothetical protein
MAGLFRRLRGFLKTMKVGGPARWRAGRGQCDTVVRRSTAISVVPVQRSQAKPNPLEANVSGA